MCERTETVYVTFVTSSQMATGRSALPLRKTNQFGGSRRESTSGSEVAQELRAIAQQRRKGVNV